MNDIISITATLKALADENRLKLIGFLAGGEYNVQAIAEELGLSESTVSHHIAKLRSIGVLNLRMEGNNHLYHLNESAWNRLKNQVFDLDNLRESESAPDDTSWLDALPLEDWEREVMRHYTRAGRIRRFPVKEKKWLVLLRWLATKFEAGITYTEPQVNAILKEVNDDHARIRRDLIEYGFMARTKDGASYWLR